MRGHTLSLIRSLPGHSRGRIDGLTFTGRSDVHCRLPPLCAPMGCRSAAAGLCGRLAAQLDHHQKIPGNPIFLPVLACRGIISRGRSFSAKEEYDTEH